jgi:hypothetical protein
MGLLEVLKQYMKDAMPGGVLNSEWTPERTNTAMSGLLDMTPVVGDVKSAYDGVQSARQGDYVGAGLGALGALPFVPNFAGIGRTDILGNQIKEMSKIPGSYPTQAELAGRLYGLGVTGKQSTNKLYNMRGDGGGAVDPELLQLIENEAIRKGRGYGM